jgi:hypothetical protein
VSDVYLFAGEPYLCTGGEGEVVLIYIFGESMKQYLDTEEDDYIGI